MFRVRVSDFTLIKYDYESFKFYIKISNSVINFFFLYNLNNIIKKIINKGRFKVSYEYIYKEQKKFCGIFVTSKYKLFII
jgi:hypothetical protein